MARTLLAQLAHDVGRGEMQMDADAENALLGYQWPGNVRELRNVLERAVLLADAQTLQPRDMRFESIPAGGVSGPDTSLTLREMEMRHIEAALREEQGRVPAAADRLGVPKSSLYQKLKNYQIDASRFRNMDAGTG